MLPKQSQLDSNMIPTMTLGNGPQLATLPLRQAYWRASNSSSDVRRCPDALSNCTESEGGCLTSTSGCQGGNLSSAQCRQGLTGVYCTQCAQAAVEFVYYRAASASSPAACPPCASNVGLTFGVGALVVLAFARDAQPAARAHHSQLAP